MPPKRKAATPAGKTKAKEAKPSVKEKKTGGKKENQKGKTSKGAETKTASPSGPSSFQLKTQITDASWTKALSSEFDQDYFKQIQAKLQADYKAKKQIFPPAEKIFNAFNLTPLDKVKVVILGQDPYHDDGQAEGLAFSVPEEITKLPPSLKNIFKELETDIPGFKAPSSGSLEKWAKQGVLLLNATLTVEAHTPNSHKDYGWQKLTDSVIKTISDQCPFVVFILWGNFAHKKEKLINGDKHLVMKDAHPSPLSFSKFKGSNCFSRTNTALQKNGLTKIDWCL